MRAIKKTDKGVAGLTILLSIITTLFVIGLLVMIFSLMGGEMRDATYTSTTVSVINESGAFVNATGYTVDNAGALNGVYTATAVWLNVTGKAWLLPSANYTLSTAGVLTNATKVLNATQWEDANVSYSYIYDAENTATEVMNDTTSGVSSVTDWFPIFIVISAMVVLILLTVIIITAIRGSGLMQGSA
jgi:hypothetical protein